jgi:hypothetical protein
VAVKRNPTGKVKGKAKVSRKPRRKAAPEHTLQVQAGGGRTRKATIKVCDAEGKLVFTDREDLESAEGRRKAARRIAGKVGKDAQAIEAALETKWAEARSKQEEEAQQAAPRPARAGDYFLDNGRICVRKETAMGPIEVVLSLFTAYIVKEVVHDFGNGERQHFFVVEGALQDGTPLPAVEVPSGDFAAMNWVLEKWGHRAVVSAGQGAKDHLRAGIQMLSGNATHEVVRQHSGWCQQGGEWFYLHGGGSIGSHGSVFSGGVVLPGLLQHMALPDPPEGEDEADAVRAALQVLDLGPDRITVAIGGAAYRAVLGECDVSIHYAGPSGVFKTEIAALTMQNFGAGFDSRHLPGNWSSTANATEGLAFAAKDMVLVIDDFAPGGSATDVARLHKDADRLFRNVGNRAARQRMFSDGSIRPPRPPRCLPVSTGEDIPRGHSVRARVIAVEVARGDIDPVRLTVCQEHAARGLYAAATAAFVRWLASRYEDLRAGFGAELATLRDELQQADCHLRMGSNLAHLVVGWRYFLQFAQDAGAIDEAERQSLYARVLAAVLEIGASQRAHQQEEEPTAKFLRFFRSCISSGRAHVADVKGEEPKKFPEAWGWRTRTVGTGEYAREEWQPQGRRVGWLDAPHVYFDPEAAHAAVQQFAADKGEAFPLPTQTLAKRLDEKGFLAEKEVGRFTVRRLLEGRRQYVWCFVAVGFFSQLTDPSEPIDPQAAEGVEGQEVAAADEWSTGESPVSQVSQNGVFHEADAAAEQTVYGDGRRF